MNEDRIALHPLYGDLPFEEQERAIVPSRDQRKIVLATNIAETSLTIEGVHVVIDSGLTRMLRYDPATGMNRLVTVPVSRASAEQRKGRAGRLGPGVCYRLYGRHDLQGMPAFTQPEILVSDLAPLALELAVWGVKDPHALSWLDAPPAAAWNVGRAAAQGPRRSRRLGFGHFAWQGDGPPSAPSAALPPHDAGARSWDVCASARTLPPSCRSAISSGRAQRTA